MFEQYKNVQLDSETTQVSGFEMIFHVLLS